MNRFTTAVFAAGLCTSLGFGAIQNIQFKDMKGNSYDLYNLLGQGKYVFVEMMFNT